MQIGEVRKAVAALLAPTPMGQACLSSPAKYLLDMVKLDDIDTEDVVETLRALASVRMVHLPHPAIYVEVLNASLGSQGDTGRLAILAAEENNSIVFQGLYRQAKWKLIPAIGRIHLDNFLDGQGYNIAMSYQKQVRSDFSLTRVQNAMIEMGAAITRLIVLRNTLHVVEETRQVQIPPAGTQRGQRPRTETYRVLKLREVVHKTTVEAGVEGRTYKGRKPPRLHLRNAHVWGRFTRPEDEWRFRPSQLVGLSDRGFVDKTYTFV
jgi:hypothetical protein